MKPIIFSGPMVNAILDNRKVQTRRVINHLLGFGRITDFGKTDTAGYDWHFRDRRGLWHDVSYEKVLSCCPFGQLGDLLWVRESLCLWPGDLFYAADDAFCEIKDWDWFESFRSATCPSIFMPKWASRLTLQLTDIQVEHLQDIDVEDAFQEGYPLSWANATADGEHYPQAIEWFYDLWDGINAKRGYGWHVNPWVWALTFEIAERKQR